MKTEIKKDEFLTEIIHDLKTPAIAQIKALESFLLTCNNKFTQDEKDLIELTLNSCNYMQRLIETFCSVHKLNYEQIKLNYEAFDIVELVNSTIKELSILLKYKELKIEINTQKEFIINADKLQIKRVIENLLSNSINYAFEKSVINIDIKKRKNNVIFQVKNESPYIEPNVLGEIFEKFKTYASCYKQTGVGLGLYLSKEIIKTHFGDMYAFSYPNNTNIFGFEIPI